MSLCNVCFSCIDRWKFIWFFGKLLGRFVTNIWKRFIQYSEIFVRTFKCIKDFQTIFFSSCLLNIMSLLMFEITWECLLFFNRELSLWWVFPYPWFIQYKEHNKSSMWKKTVIMLHLLLVSFQRLYNFPQPLDKCTNKKTAFIRIALTCYSGLLSEILGRQYAIRLCAWAFQYQSLVVPNVLP